MLNRIIYLSVYNRGVVLFLTFLVMLAGIVSFQKLPIDAVPDITNNQVQINTVIDGLAPEEIERTVTFPVESAIRGISGVEQVRSLTRFGLSQVTVIFKDSYDIYRARQLVTERLQSILSNLPSDAHPKLGPISSGLGEIYQYVIDFKEKKIGEERVLQLMELKSLQDWYIKPRLLTIEGVAEVNTSGGFEKQYHVQPDSKKMSSFGIHFDDIKKALEKVNKNVGGGYVEQTAEQFLIQGIGLLKNTKDIEKVPVKILESFRVITIGDIATVQLGKELRTGSATYKGEEVVLGTIMMLLGENSRTVSTRVHHKIEEISKTLPADIRLTTVYNRSDLVNATLVTIEHNLILGALLVTLILLIFLGHFRAALITAVTIPLSLFATFMMMKPLGLSGNLMSLGALDFGIIVDGTVIVLDNCVRYLQKQSQLLGRNLTKEELKKAIYEATVEIRTAAGFGELIVIMVFLPVFALTGVEGKMFQPMAATFIFAVLSALVMSFTTAPALASLFLSGKVEEKETRLMGFIKNLYIPIFEWAFQRKKITLVLSAFSIVLGILLFINRGAEFLPQLSEGSFDFHIIRPVNTSLTQSVEFQKKSDRVLEAFPEVMHVFSRIGTSEIATDPMGVNVSDTYIMLYPREKWPEINDKKRTYAELVNLMVHELEQKLPGQTYLASQPIQMRFNELLEGTRADVSVKIFGPDLEKLVEYAKKTQEVILKIQGAGDVEVDLAGTSPVLKIEPNEKNLVSFNASMSDVLDTISIALGGQEVGSMYEGEKKFPIIVRLNNEIRENLDSIKELPVGVGSNAVAQLGQLTDIHFKETYSSVNRENSHRRTAVLINLRNRDTESFVKEAQKIVVDQIKLPVGYYFEWGGQFKNLQQAKSRLMILAPLALILVLAMVYAAFGSVIQTLLILGCVPLALVGGVIGLIVNDLPFSISAGIGFAALSGIAVLNGVVLVHFFNQLKAEGQSGKDLVLTGTLIRLRPVMMTALVAIFGFIPMMISSGIGSEVQRPLASVVVGGIISSTILTLIVLPILFVQFEKWMNVKKSL